MTVVDLILEDFNVYIHKFHTARPATVEDFDIIVHTAKGLTPDIGFNDYYAYDINGIAYKKSFVGTDMVTNLDSVDNYKRPTKLNVEIYNDSITYAELNKIFNWQQINQEIIFIDGANRIISYETTDPDYAMRIGRSWGSAGTDDLWRVSYFGAYAGYIVNAPGHLVHQAKVKSGIITLDILITRIGISVDYLDPGKTYTKGCTHIYNWFNS